MAAKNLYLNDELAAVSSAYAEGNRRHKNLSRLVSHLLTAHLRTNSQKVREVCRSKGMPFPSELLSKGN